MGIIDDGKLQNILPKYSELKLGGKNLAQQYVSAFNTGMNIYQCINQLQGYIEWVVKAVNDVVVQWNETVDSQLHETINASKQATTEQFNTEWVNLQPTLNTTVENLVDTRLDTRLDTFTKIAKIGKSEDYYVLTETKDKLIIKLDDYIKYSQPYTKGAPYYIVSQLIKGLDLSGYTLKTAVLKNNIFKLTDSSGELIDYVYLNLNNPVVSGGEYGGKPYTQIETKFTPAVTKFTGKEEANGNLDVNTCVTLIFEKTS
jgi:hypothetical protein|nr:MAG TPA: hypothetical protein [Caudoviricetes sp.]